ncbi:MAG: GntR family transcriptional regulator [Alphaproteobacteria bacterium]
MKVQKALGTPLHHQIYLILREAILSGRHPAGEPLPPEEALTRMFDVSRITVRRALDSLDRADLIERRQGRGTFVRADVLPTPLRMPITSVFKSMEAFGKRTEARVLEFGYETASPQVQAMLRVGAVPVQRAVRVRLRKERPVAHLTTWVPEAIGGTYTEADMAVTPLYRLMRRAGAFYARGEQTISATLADPIVAARLETKVGAPLLELRRQVFDQSDRAVEYLELVASPETFQVRMSLDGPDLSPAEVQPD